jgi:hypothetical protein
MHLATPYLACALHTDEHFLSDVEFRFHISSVLLFLGNRIGVQSTPAYNLSPLSLCLSQVTLNYFTLSLVFLLVDILLSTLLAFKDVLKHPIISEVAPHKNAINYFHISVYLIVTLIPYSANTLAIFQWSLVIFLA